MERKEKTRILIGAIINLIVVGLGIFCLCVFIKYLLIGNKDIRFRYYTNISNLTVATISGFNAFFLIKSLVKNKLYIPKVLSIIKFAGLGMVILTFFTVIFIIVPITGFLPMYSDLKFITHFVLPVIAVFSYFFFEEKTIFEFKYMFFAWLPPVIYSCVYIPCVVFFKVWPDLYQINTNGLWFIFSPLTCMFGFALATGFYFLKKLSVKETKKKA